MIAGHKYDHIVIEIIFIFYSFRNFELKQNEEYCFNGARVLTDSVRQFTLNTYLN